MENEKPSMVIWELLSGLQRIWKAGWPHPGATPKGKGGGDWKGAQNGESHLIRRGAGATVSAEVAQERRMTRQDSTSSTPTTDEGVRSGGGCGGGGGGMAEPISHKPADTAHLPFLSAATAAAGGGGCGLQAAHPQCGGSQAREGAEKRAKRIEGGGPNPLLCPILIYLCIYLFIRKHQPH